MSWDNTSDHITFINVGTKDLKAGKKADVKTSRLLRLKWAKEYSSNMEVFGLGFFHGAMEHRDRDLGQPIGLPCLGSDFWDPLIGFSIRALHSESSQQETCHVGWAFWCMPFCHSAIFCHQKTQRNFVSESRERRLSASLCRERWFAPSLCRSSLVSNWLVHVHVLVSRTRDECCCVMCYKSRPTWIVRRVDPVGNWRDGPDYHYKIQG